MIITDYLHFVFYLILCNEFCLHSQAVLQIDHVATQWCIPCPSCMRKQLSGEKSTAWQEALGSRIRLSPLESLLSLFLGAVVLMIP